MGGLLVGRRIMTLVAGYAGKLMIFIEFQLVAGGAPAERRVNRCRRPIRRAAPSLQQDDQDRQQQARRRW